jgi:hypothetical protein
MNGRVAVSANPFAPRVEFYADFNQDNTIDLMMGDNTRVTANAVTLRVHLAGKTLPTVGYTIRVVKNGASFSTFSANGLRPTNTFTGILATAERTYYRVMVGEGPPTAYTQVPESMTLSGNMGLIESYLL